MAQRVRRTPVEAKRVILEAAEAILARGGPSAVHVRAVAAEVGITDAAVNHHFGNRDRLLAALLKHGGSRLRQRVRAVVDGWEREDAELEELVDALAGVYADGYAELALALHQSGWRDRGSGMLEDVVDALHRQVVARARAQRRAPPERRRTQLTVAALHQALAMELLFGDDFRRSAGLTPADTKRGAAQTRSWWVEAAQRMLDG